MNIYWKLYLDRLAILVACVMVVACTRQLTDITPRQESQFTQIIDVGGNRNVDILFVIDNSYSMAAEQRALVSQFDSFLAQLETLSGGLPNVHIGVVTTDVGVGGISLPWANCAGGNGEDGLLQAGSNCFESQDARYIKNIANVNGTRTTNYPENKTLKETFSCIARVGIGGCGYESPLEAIRRALDGRHQANLGFLRDDALLVIIVVADEDDCSVKNSTIVQDDGNTGLDSPLGPVSFRCFEFGVLCDEPARTAGIKTNCKSHPNSPYVYDAQEYIDFVLDLKADPSQILVAGIIGKNMDGPLDSVEVTFDETQNLLGHKGGCTSALGDVSVALRTGHFVTGFPQHISESICSADFTPILNRIGETLRRVIADPCQETMMFFDVDPDTEGLQVDCTVSDVNESARDQSIVHPQCASGTDLETVTEPCWRLCQQDASLGDALYCDAAKFSCDQSGQISIQVFPSNREIRSGVNVVAKCAAQ